MKEHLPDMGPRRTPAAARRTRSGASRAIALPLALAVVGSAVLFSSLASADTATTHTAVASTAGGPTVPAAGTISDLVDASVVTVRVTQHSAADPIFAIQRIAQCEGGLSITQDSELDPTLTGFCLDQPLSPNTNTFKQDIVKASVDDTFVETTFIVGTGTRDVPFDDGTSPPPNTITCDATHDCSLWVQIARTGGSDFVHFDLHFGPASGTTTTTVGAVTTTTVSGVTTTTLTGGATTTTLPGGSTTTTVGGSTTSTTKAGSTTSTSAGASTTSTTARSGAAAGGGNLPTTGGDVLRITFAALLLGYAGWLFGVAALRRRERLGVGR